MDDYSVASLVESRNEWCIRLLNIITPLIIEGFNSIWKDAFRLAKENNEKSKYLMVFQNLLGQIPKWSGAIVEKERQRIIESGGCNYLEDLLTCVHVIQLKALTCVRVGQKQKKIELDIPTLDKFIHNVYINCARKIYTNVYLYETGIPVLQVQKHNRELELIIRECIMDTVRDSIPTEHILRAYMEETEEENVETKEEIINVEEPVEKDTANKESANETKEGGANSEVNTKEGEKKNETEDVKIERELSLSDLVSSLDTDEDTKVSKKEPSSSLTNEVITKLDSDTSSSNEELKKPGLSFNDTDVAVTDSGRIEKIDAPKDIDRLEKISEENFAKRKAEEEEEDDEALVIGDDFDLELDNILELN